MSAKKDRFAWVIILFCFLILIGCDFGTKSRYYFIDVINSGKAPTQLTVSLAPGSWTIAPGEAKVIKVENQDDKEAKTERVFTMITEGETKTVKSKLGSYAGRIVLDITGTNCFVAADYGPQFRTKDAALPDGTDDIVVLKKFKGEQVFIPETFDMERSAFDFNIVIGLGEPIPKNIRTGNGNIGIPKLVRLINVPCATMDDAKALYDYLNKN